MQEFLERASVPYIGTAELRVSGRAKEGKNGIERNVLALNSSREREGMQLLLIFARVPWK